MISHYADETAHELDRRFIAMRGNDLRRAGDPPGSAGTQLKDPGGQGANHGAAGHSALESLCVEMLFQTATSHALWMPMIKSNIETALMP